MSSSADSIYLGMVEQPCPAMTLRIGVAGHRHLEKDQLPVLRQQLKQIYADIHQVVQKSASHETAKNIYAPDQFVLRFISSLAEGADRLCIEPEVIPFEYELAAILPFNKAEYEKDFEPGKSVVDPEKGTIDAFYNHLDRIGYNKTGDNARVPLIELDGNPSRRSEAYNECARVLVEHSDLLVAVYDGDHSKHIGTAATVRMAVERGVPVIHVSTLTPGKVAIRPSGLFGHASSELKCTLDNLEDELNRLLLFTDMMDRDGQVIERFRRYRMGESLSCNISSEADFAGAGPIDPVTAFPTLGSRVFSLFKNMMTRGSKVGQVVDEMNCSAAIDADRQKRSVIGGAVSSHRLYSAFLRADRLASYYANIHRGIFLLIYIFGALALTAAACALAFGDHHGVVFALVVFELLLLVLIYRLFRKDRRRDYHGRWLEYRCLAELLRPLIYMNSLGRSFTLFTNRNTSTTLNREFVGHHSSARRWIYVYLVSVYRWAGFPHCPLDGEYKKDVAAFINEAWIGSQIDYHTRNAAQMQVMGQRLKSFSFVLFLATIAAVLVKLGLLSVASSFHTHFSSGLMSSVGLLTAVFPILAAMAFSIRNHAEFDISAQRSFTMRAVLLVHFKAHQKNASNMTSEKIYRDLQRIADKSIDETADWFEIYEVKEVEPA